MLEKKLLWSQRRALPPPSPPWENKSEDLCYEQDVCYDKLDMFQICELQTMSVELVHQFYVFTNESVQLESFNRNKNLHSFWISIQERGEEKAEITME